MSDFTFTATAECELCGNYLSESDEECDHDGREPKTHVFRYLYGGRETARGVEAVGKYRWNKLEEKVGDEWIGYHYLGTEDEVNAKLLTGAWGDIEDLPRLEMALDAPDDVGEKD